MILKILGALVIAGLIGAGLYWLSENVWINRNPKDKE